MNFSEFTFKLLILFLPGLLAFKLVEALTVHRDLPLHRIVIDSFLYGFISYAVYWTFTLIPNLGLSVSFLHTLSANEAPIDLEEVLIVSLIAIPVGLGMSAAINYKLLFRFGHALEITKKFGDLDVWSFVANAEETGWIIVRDYENDLMYYGWLEAFSDSVGRDEVYLTQVSVSRNSTSEKLYDIPGVYLGRDRAKISIEIAPFKTNQGEDDAV